MGIRKGDGKQACCSQGWRGCREGEKRPGTKDPQEGRLPRELSKHSSYSLLPKGRGSGCGEILRKCEIIYLKIYRRRYFESYNHSLNRITCHDSI